MMSFPCLRRAFGQSSFLVRGARTGITGQLDCTTTDCKTQWGTDQTQGCQVRSGVPRDSWTGARGYLLRAGQRRRRGGTAQAPRRQSSADWQSRGLRADWTWTEGPGHGDPGAGQADAGGSGPGGDPEGAGGVAKRVCRGNPRGRTGPTSPPFPLSNFTREGESRTDRDKGLSAGCWTRRPALKHRATDRRSPVNGAEADMTTASRLQPASFPVAPGL